MKKAVEYLGYTMVVLLMVAAVFTYLTPHLGWRVDAVLSGSMEPQLKVGSLVVVRPVEPESIVVGDAITFHLTGVDETIVTHRVIDIRHNSPLYFETKGDANEKPDPFIVPARDLVGRICLHVPFLGYFTEFLKTLHGFIFAVVIPGLVLIIIYIWSVWRELTQKRRNRIRL
ncbi:signal peptidase I [Chloroflexota bacterium]